MESTKELLVLTKQEQIAENAKILPGVSFTSLAYHMDLEWLHEAYRQTRKDGAPGVDEVSVDEYARNLEGNLRDLLERAKSGKYKAPAVKRVYIPKGKGKGLRPLGIPTLEDKILQRAVKMLIEPIYEQEFYDCSYGFRVGKSAHQALEQLWENAMDTNGWIIDLDIRKYFETIERSKLREIIRQRVNDGVINRLLGKWLKAGISEEGRLYYNKDGTPQGGVISPLLSNIYLHEVLDKWFIEVVKPRLKGKTYMIRFADDVIMGFSRKEEALKVMEVLPKRLMKYGLELHSKKTRLVRFKRKNEKGVDKDDNDKSGTFNFLGFTHYWGISRKGNQTVKRKTQKERYARALRNIKQWCKRNRHEPISVQAKELSKKVIGHYGYYGITNNIRQLRKFHDATEWIWYKWLRRRSRNKGIKYESFKAILRAYPLPKPRIVHSYI